MAAVLREDSEGIGAAPIKTCSWCGETKPLDAFYRRRDGKQGRTAHCKDCHREAGRRRYAEDPVYGERQKDRSRRWRAENPQEASERARRYRQEHLAACRARDRQYWVDNREALQAKYRAYYERHAAKIRERASAWVKANPGRHRHHAHRRRELVSATQQDHADMAAVMAALRASACCYCGATDDITIDHVVPLSRGGRHEPSNLAAACRPCNASKGRKLLSEWRARSPT